MNATSETSSPHAYVYREMTPRAAGAVLLAIAITGIALRVCHLGSESIWWDEYTSVMHLGAPDLGAFLKLNRTLDPATLPLYYSIEYLWWRHVSDTILGLRCVSVFLGLLTLPLVYLLGKQLYGRTAGIIATLCFALSPVHIFHDQGIRMYVLMDLLAVISAYTFINVVRCRSAGVRYNAKRWWAAHLAANVLLLWTHPFTILILLVEGCFLLIFRLRDLRCIGTWIASHALLLIPSIVYFTHVRFWSSDQTEAWLRLPNVPEFLGDVFGDDVVSLTYQLRMSDSAWSFLPSSLAHTLVSAHPLFDALLLAVFAVSMAFLVKRAFHRTTDPAETPGYTREPIVFLLIWLCLPACLLYAASLLWRPCIFPRYTLYSSIALYVIAGGAIAALRKNDAKIIAAAAIAVFYAYQIALVPPGSQRTDWKAASTLIAAQGGPKDLILVHASEAKLVQASREMFTLTAGQTNRPVSCAKKLDVLADQADFFLDRCAKSTDPLERKRNAWALLVLPPFDTGPSKEFEANLSSRRLEYTLTELGGIEHLLVFAIRQPPAAETRVPPQIQDTLEASKAFGDLAMALAEKGEYDHAMAALKHVEIADSAAIRPYENLAAALQKNEDVTRTIAAIRAFLKGTGFQENGQTDFAVEAYRNATDLDPQFIIAWHSLATTLVDQAKYEDALPALQKTIELYVGDAMVYGHLADVIARKGDIARARQALALFLKGTQLGDTGDVDGMMNALRTSIETDPGYGLAYLALGIAQLETGDQNGCVNAMRKACQLDAHVANLFQPFFEALFETKDYDRAWREFNTMRAKGFDVPASLVEKLKRDSGRNG